jgi:hypothetical protein
MDSDMTEVVTMTPGQALDAEVVERLTQPDYWLVSGLEWPGNGPMAEAAVAIAPGMIPRNVVGRDAAQILRHADHYAEEHAVRVVLFSDLTRTLTLARTSWAELGIDWQAARDDLQSGPYPSLYLTISERAYVLLCSAAVTVNVISRKGVQPGNDERELVRQALTDQLSADWPSYIRDLICSGRLRAAG